MALQPGARVKILEGEHKDKIAIIDAVKGGGHHDLHLEGNVEVTFKIQGGKKMQEVKDDRSGRLAVGAAFVAGAVVAGSAGAVVAGALAAGAVLCRQRTNGSIEATTTPAIDPKPAPTKLAAEVQTTPGTTARAAPEPSTGTDVKTKRATAKSDPKDTTAKKLDFDSGEGDVVMPTPLIEHAEKLKAKDLKAFKGPLFASAATPLCTDIHQGDIGDCYLAAALTLIAAYEPEAIVRAITEVELDKGKGGKGRAFQVGFGLYARTGKKTEDVLVTVDDRFYLDPDVKGEPLYLNTGDKKASGCIWQMVLEKAWAAYVSRAYDAVNNPKQDPAKAFAPSYEFVGADNKTFNAIDNVNDACRGIAGWRVEAKSISQGNAIEELWKHVLSGQPAAFGTGKETKDMIRLMLYAEHQYAVVGFDEKGKDGRSLILRNPHNKLKGGPGPAVPQVIHRAKTAPKKELYKSSHDGKLKMADAFVLPMDEVSEKVFETVYLMWRNK